MSESTKSRIIKITYLLIGLGLAAFVIQQSDMDLIWARCVEVGVFGLIIVLLIYGAGFLVDTFSWQLTIEGLSADIRKSYRLWKIRMVGEAFNSATPLGTMGGEPIKAALLKQSLGVGYDQGIASLVLARTVNLIGLVAYLFIGFGLIVISPNFDTPFKVSTGGALVIFATAICIFFLIQRHKGLSKVSTLVARFRWGRPLLPKLESLRQFETHLLRFYVGLDGRFPRATGLAFINWLIGTVEVYAIMAFMGTPISIWDAWVLEAAVQLTRTATFFIPLSLGTQEGVLFVIAAAITGNGALGLAISLIKRFREMVWIAWGFAIGLRIKPQAAVEAVSAEKN